MNTCKTCRWWKDGYCDIIDTTMNNRPETLIQIDVQVDDDSNLSVRLKTGPEFGCVHHDFIKNDE